MNSKTVYEPEEDSYLLSECVKKYSFGKVLDMGTGSGIQGFTALKSRRVTSVTFADINSKAISYVKNIIHKDKEDYDLKKINFLQTDLFSKIKNSKSSISKLKNSKNKNIVTKFDTIVFNPPYLPDDEFDEEKLITTGGKNGYEIIDKFLKNSKNHLTMDGQIILLFSSLSDKGEVDRIIKKYSFEKNLVAKKGLFMEQLYVYILKIKRENIFRGNRGIVEMTNLKINGIKRKVAIKYSLNSFNSGPFVNNAYTATEEVKFLKVLNKNGIGPKFYKFPYINSDGNTGLVMEFIDGKRINDYFLTASYENIILVLKEVLNQLFKMDTLGINKLELTNPYKHIIIRELKTKNKNKSRKTSKVIPFPVLIDFERSIYTENPKNITQFIQYLCSGSFIAMMSNKGIVIDKEKLIGIAKTYKNHRNESDLEKIISCVRINKN